MPKTAILRNYKKVSDKRFLFCTLQLSVPQNLFIRPNFKCNYKKMLLLFCFHDIMLHHSIC